MVRIVQTLYPTLCRVERETRGQPADDGTSVKLRLDGVPFEQAVNDHRAIERGLLVFDEAWHAGAIALRSANGKLIPPSRGKAVVPACGYSVEHVRRYFLDRAARLILRRVPDVYDRVADAVTDIALLPRLRRIGTLRPAVINEIVRGFHGDARKALFSTEDAVLDAIMAIQPRVLKALRETLDAEFPRLMTQAGSEYLVALAESLTVPEQVQDLGKALLRLQTPEAVRAIGSWDVHDVTEAINADREAKDIPPLKVPAHTTDIRVLRGHLGPEFDALMAASPSLLRVYGHATRELRDMDPGRRGKRVELMALFCQRYMSYLTEASVIGLFLLAPTDQAKVPGPLLPNIAEAFFILEGLWGKKGYGRKFFETILGSDEGGRAMRLLMLDLVGLKQRGSVKSADDLEQIVANSDLLDSHILKYMAGR